MQLHGVDIIDTFAEAFSTKVTRLIITAATERWATIAANQACGYATSVIACDCEAAIDQVIPAEASPDGRPGVSVLMFAFSRDALAKAAQQRVGQCILTCPTTACYNGLPEGDDGKSISVGGAIRYFGDGLQSSKKLGKRRFWRLPVMDGEFLCEDKFGTLTGVAGGNILICGRDAESTLKAAEAASEAMQSVEGVILPFPGGIVRSGSKVGSKYPKLKASTNDPYCPTVRPLSQSEIPAECECVYEIVADGLNFDVVQQAMKLGLHAAAETPGILQITAGNYGGKLGKHHFHLSELL